MSRQNSQGTVLKKTGNRKLGLFILREIFLLRCDDTGYRLQVGNLMQCTSLITLLAAVRHISSWSARTSREPAAALLSAPTPIAGGGGEVWSTQLSICCPITSSISLLSSNLPLTVANRNSSLNSFVTGRRGDPFQNSRKVLEFAVPSRGKFEKCSFVFCVSLPLSERQ